VLCPARCQAVKIRGRARARTRGRASVQVVPRLHAYTYAFRTPRPGPGDGRERTGTRDPTAGTRAWACSAGRAPTFSCVDRLVGLVGTKQRHTAPSGFACLRRALTPAVIRRSRRFLPAPRRDQARRRIATGACDQLIHHIRRQCGYQKEPFVHLASSLAAPSSPGRIALCDAE